MPRWVPTKRRRTLTSVSVGNASCALRSLDGLYPSKPGSTPGRSSRAKAQKGPLTMKVTVNIPEKTISYLLDDCGHHIRYWAREAERKDAFVLRVSDGEKWYRLAVRRALETMAVKAPRHFGMLLSGNYDGETCDLFVQYGCFGEAVYG